MKFNLKQTDVVLEVGSGDNPREQSKVLIDRFITKDHQRAGRFKMRIDRPLVVGDGYNLPFKDQSFDYVICSHVLEHLENPIAFAKELMRVGKRGYVEVPSIYGERLFGWSFHLWHNEYKNNQLIMTKKSEGERFGSFFHTLIAKQIWFRRFFEEHESKFYIQFEWDKNFIVKVQKQKHSAVYLEKIDMKIWQLLQKVDWNIYKDIMFYCNFLLKRIDRKFKKIIRKTLWKIKVFFLPKSIIDQLLPLMQCINCANELKLSKKKLICYGCKKTYPLDEFIPVMLGKKDMEKGY